MKTKDFYSSFDRISNIIERAKKYGLEVTEPIETMNEEKLDRVLFNAERILLTNIQCDRLDVAHIGENRQNYFWEDHMGFAHIGWFDMNNKDFYRYGEENKKFEPISNRIATAKDYVVVGRQIDSRARVVLLLARYQF